MTRSWSQQDDAVLRQLVTMHGKQWTALSLHIPNRTPGQVAARWEKCIGPAITKGTFTPDEGAQIANYVAAHGPKNWPDICQLLPHRSSKQRRERWINHLDPSVEKDPWTIDEDNLTYQQFKGCGPRWSGIAKLLPGRSDSAIKNRFHSSIHRSSREFTSIRMVGRPCSQIPALGSINASHGRDRLSRSRRSHCQHHRSFFHRRRLALGRSRRPGRRVDLSGCSHPRPGRGREMNHLR
jgi:hypothetical protein